MDRAACCRTSLLAVWQTACASRIGADPVADDVVVRRSRIGQFDTVRGVVRNKVPHRARTADGVIRRAAVDVHSAAIVGERGRSRSIRPDVVTLNHIAGRPNSVDLDTVRARTGQNVLRSADRATNRIVRNTRIGRTKRCQEPLIVRRPWQVNVSIKGS